jgi:hypothetical protein
MRPRFSAPRTHAGRIGASKSHPHAGPVLIPQAPARHRLRSNVNNALDDRVAANLASYLLRAEWRLGRGNAPTGSYPKALLPAPTPCADWRDAPDCRRQSGQR